MSRRSNGAVRHTDLRRRGPSFYEYGLDLYGLITDCPTLPGKRGDPHPSPIRQESRLPSSLVPHDESERSTYRLARLVAIVAGMVGALLCALIPLLPVTQTTATILWPQGGVNADGHITDITAPLVSGAPRALGHLHPVRCDRHRCPPTVASWCRRLPVNGFENRQKRTVRAGQQKTPSSSRFRDSVATAAPRSAVCRR